MTRIIAGRAGSLRLEVPKRGTRPTSDRVREAIFSTLGSWNLLDGSYVLDLYAGSGALGLEAASRGAISVTLVEKHPPAAQILAKNMGKVEAAFPAGSAPRFEVARQSVQSFLVAASERDPAPAWDIALLDPPYDLGEGQLAEDLAALAPMLTEDAAVLVERSSRSPEPTWPQGLSLVRERRYGETVLWWAEPAR